MGPVKAIRVQKDHGAGRKVHTGGDSGCGKDRIQLAVAHQPLEHQFPGGQLTGMMGTNCQVFKKPALTVFANVRALMGKDIDMLFQNCLTVIVDWRFSTAQLQGTIAVCPGFQEKKSR